MSTKFATTPDSTHTIEKGQLKTKEETNSLLTRGRLGDCCTFSLNLPQVLSAKRNQFFVANFLVFGNSRMIDTFDLRTIKKTIVNKLKA